MCRKEKKVARSEIYWSVSAGGSTGLDSGSRLTIRG